jgi:preprotein translocase subunit YajC
VGVEKEMFFWNLLTSASESASSSATASSGDFGTWLMLGGAIILIVVMMVFNGRSQKKRQQEMQETLNALKPGCKVKTIGGICGVVVEVCPEDNTFVLETGTEASGKSYLKFDKQAIYQTDAGLQPAPVEDPTVVGETVEEPAVEETVEEPAVEETTVEQPAAEEVFEEELKED